MSNINLLSTTESNAERKGTLRRKSDYGESEGVLRYIMEHSNEFQVCKIKHFWIDEGGFQSWNMYRFKILHNLWNDTTITWQFGLDRRARICTPYPQYWNHCLRDNVNTLISEKTVNLHRNICLCSKSDVKITGI